jgi:hypothetical protein
VLDTIDPAAIPTQYLDTAASLRAATAQLPAGAPLEVWVLDPVTRIARRAAVLTIRPVVRGKRSRLAITILEPEPRKELR